MTAPLIVARCLGLLLLALPFLAGCDPCSGVLACEDTPRLRYEGRVEYTFRPEQPAEGVLVEFVRTGGPELTPGTLSATTDSLGWFELEGSAAGDGEVSGYLLIHAAEPIPPVRIDGVTLAVTHARGELRYLGAWSIPHPYLRYVGELYHRGSGKPAANVQVEFRRTGGIRAVPDTLRAVTDSTGRFFFNQRVTEHGTLRGDLYVVPLPPLKPFVIPGVSLETAIEDAPTRLVGRWGIGLHLPYAGLLLYDETGGPVVGATVRVRRIGGVPTVEETFVTRTNAAGTFALDLKPILDGEVVVEISVDPPEGYAPLVLRDLRLQSTQLETPTSLITMLRLRKP